MTEATPDEITRLRRLLEAQERRHGALAATVIHALIVSTVAVLLAGLVLPFFVPRSGDARSATLWQALTEKDAPDIVPDAGGGWFIPIAATLLVIGVVVSLWEGAARGPLLAARRVLTICYLVGCLLGFAVIGAYDESPRPAGAPIGLVLLTVGAAIAVVLSFSRVLEDHRTYSGNPFR